MNRRALAAALTVAVTTIAPLLGAQPALADTPVAPCVPTQLPGLAGTDNGGEVMWINDSGLLVGSADTATTGPDGLPLFTATYWTNDGSGYQIHTLPNDPLVNDEVLDVNQHGRMIVYGWDPAANVSASLVYDLATNRWFRLASLGPDTRGRRINDAGVVAGGGSNSNGDSFAATWAPPYTKANKLPRVGFGTYAPGINNAGVAVGGTLRGRYTPAMDDSVRHSGLHGYYPNNRAMRWAANGTATTLPSLYTQGEAFAINDAGLIVGSSDTPQFDVDAAYWLNGAVHDMGGRPGWFTEARGLSQGGWATGDSEDYNSPTDHAFVWTGAGTLQYLTALDGTDGSSNTHAVNDHLRQVGGWSDISSTQSAPTLWQCPADFSTAG
jgi:hypothetical protein